MFFPEFLSVRSLSEDLPEWHGLDIIRMECWGQDHADDGVVQAPLCSVHTPREPGLCGAGEG